MGVCYQFDTVEVSPAAFAVVRGGERLNLEPKAVRVLIHLIRHRDRAVTKDELVESVWEGTAVTDNAVTRVIAQIRRELGDDSRAPRYVETIPTAGYRFIAEVREVTAEAPAPVQATRRSRTIPALVAACAILPAGWWLIRPARDTKGRDRDVPVTQVTTAAGVDARASFGPDGASFVYSSNRSGQFELYRRGLSGNSQPVPVTNDGQQNIQPAWSPDGKWIAYHSAARRGIWVVPPGGGVPRRVTDFGSAPAWSPDSRTIAFTSAEPFSLAPFDPGDPATLWTIATDGSSLKQVTVGRSPRGSHVSPSWSSDGKSLVFVSLARESAIHSLDLASSQSTPVVLAGQDIPRQPGTMVSRIWDPVYSPADGNLYFSAAGDKGEYSIWVLSKPGEAPRRLHTSRSETLTGLSISPDGSRLLFTPLRNVSQLWTTDGESAPKPLFQEQVLRATIPNYSPDGKWLAFSVETQGRNRDIWVMTADGGQALPVSADPAAKESGVNWTAGGELLYNSVAGADVEFRAYDPVSKKSRVIHRRNTTGLFHPVLLPNMKEMLASCSMPFNVCIGTPSGTAPPRQITFERNGAAFAFSDRAGEWIAHNVLRGDTTQIGIIRSDGTGSKVLTDDPARNWASSFSPDGRRIAYASLREGVWNLWWIDRVTGERRQLTRETAFGSFVRAPAFRPGSREIAYESFQVRGNIFLLELR